jgi:hypothetical protein
MFFEHVELHDFRSHVETILDLARLNVIRGPNAAGKSTLAQGFGYLLAARSADTGENGQGGEKLIRMGQKKATIVAKLRSGAKARVTLTPKSGREFQHKDGEWPAYSRDVLSCLCSTRYFVDLPSRQQHDLIGAMVIPPDAPIDPRVSQLANSLGVASEATAAYDWLTAIYDAAFAERRDAKRDAKNLLPVEAPDGEAFPIEEVRTRLYQRRQERDAKLVERSSLLQAQQTWRRDHSSLRERQATLQGRETAEAQRAQAFEAKLLSDADVAKHHKTIEREGERQRLTQRFNEIEAELRQREQEKSQLLQLDDVAACPTCKQAIHAEYLDLLLKPAAEAVGTLLSQRSDLAKELGKIPSGDEAKQKIAQHTHAKEELKVTNQRLEQVRADLGNIQADIARLGDEPAAASTETLEQDIRALDERIHEGEKAERQSLRAEQDKQAYDAYLAKRGELEQRIADLEQLVAFTAPEGVRTAMARQYMDTFFGVIAGVLQNFGYEVSLDRGLWQVNGLELDRLSESEQLRFGVAFQVALAVSSGAGFVIIDQFDLLDNDSRGVLMGTLMGEERLEQVIVIGTNDSLEIPDVEDAAFFRFDRAGDGTTTAMLLTPEEVAA